MKLPPTDSDPSLPLWEHLEELRRRIVYCLLVVAAVFCVTYCHADALVYFLEKPLLAVLPPGAAHLYFTGLTDKFFTYVQVSGYAALFLSAPFLLLQLWLFVSPALLRHEKKVFIPFLCLGSGFFTLGLCFAYYGVLPLAYRFLVDFGSPQEKAMLTLTPYFSLTLKLLLGLGLVFEIPVVLACLGRLGILTASMLVGYRRHAIVANAVLAAVITPTPDAFTMLLVMVPLCLLYELGILGVRWFSPTGG